MVMASPLLVSESKSWIGKLLGNQSQKHASFCLALTPTATKNCNTVHLDCIDVVRRIYFGFDERLNLNTKATENIIRFVARSRDRKTNNIALQTSAGAVDP